MIEVKSLLNRRLNRICRDCAEFGMLTNGWCYPYKREHGDDFPPQGTDYSCEEWNPFIVYEHWIDLRGNDHYGERWGTPKWTKRGKMG